MALESIVTNVNANIALQALENTQQQLSVTQKQISTGYSVADATDNFAARFLLADACRLLGRPLVQAALTQFAGQLTTYLPTLRPCYRCFFPHPPADGTIAGCAEAGVLGASAGVVGSLQALEAVRLLVGGPTLAGHLLVLDLWSLSQERIALPPAADCPLCGHDWQGRAQLVAAVERTLSAAPAMVAAARTLASNAASAAIAARKAVTEAIQIQGQVATLDRESQDLERRLDADRQLLTALDAPLSGSGRRRFLDWAERRLDLGDALAALMGRGQTDFNGSLFNLFIDADLKDPAHYAVYVSQAGLGLPDRDYYLKPEFAAQKGKYETYIAQLLQLIGWPNPAQAAKDVVAFETELARASWTKAQQRDPLATYNPMGVRQLVKFAPGMLR